MRQTPSVKLAVKKGTVLEALRDRLAAAVDDDELLPQLAMNARALLAVDAALVARPVAAKGDDLAELRKRRAARRSS